MKEITETEIIEDSKFDQLESEFAKFIAEVESTTSRISADINIDELQNIGDEIIKARNYLMSFAKGEKKSIREKAYGQLSSIPLLGNFAKKKIEQVQQQDLKDSTVKKVLGDMFNRFDEKKKRILDLSVIADDIYTQLSSQEISLGSYIKKLEEVINTTDKASIKLKAIDMSIQAQSQDKIVKDQIYNKLKFIVELMETLMVKMSKNIPVIKAQLLNETSIAGIITNISDSVKMMNTLADLTHEISVISTNNIHELIVDVTGSLSRTKDIEHAKQFIEINNKHQETMKNARIKYIENTVENYNALKVMNLDMSRQLENRLKSESEVLGISLQKGQ